MFDCCTFRKSYCLHRGRQVRSLQLIGMEMNECSLMNCSAKWTVTLFVCDCIVIALKEMFLKMQTVYHCVWSLISSLRCDIQIFRLITSSYLYLNNSLFYDLMWRLTCRLGLGMVRFLKVQKKSLMLPFV